MSPPDHPERSSGERGLPLLSRLRALEIRDLWWRLLDALEARRALRRSLYAVGILAVLAVAAAVWVYPWWRQRSAVSMARQWLEAGRLDHASESIQEALKVAPESPESWKLAADLARRLGNQTSALTYSREAARRAPADFDLQLAWASDALLAEQADETARVLAALPAAAREQSARARRIAGELARRRLDLATAREEFEAALRIEGPVAINEVPLGVVLIKSADAALRRRGLEMLAKWTPDPLWGANAARTLLQDAISRDDRPAMRQWAEALRAHPRCTLGDLPNCLLALSRTDEARFAEVLAGMEKNHAADAGNIALLVSWLNQIGRSAEAVRWIKTLPPALTQNPPAAVGVAESLRQLSDWPALADWTRHGDWGGDLEPVRQAYAFAAARRSGRTAEAGELWDTLKSRAATDGGRTLFTADTLYAWGLHDEAITLLWSGADQPEISIQALGTLARHYQVGKDAAGQYRVFKRLHSLRAQDASIANNYAFFATLTGNDLRMAEQVAEGNFRRAPDNLAYRSTYALVLVVQNRAAEALAVLGPVIAGWKNTPVIVLPYGLALAETGKSAEARTVLATLDPATLTPEESALVEKALR